MKPRCCTQRPAAEARRAVCAGVLAWLIVAGSARAEAVQLGYSFTKPAGGGIAVVTIDMAAGKIVAQRTLFETPRCRQPAKLRRTADRSVLLLTNETGVSGAARLFLVDNSASPRVRASLLPGTPDELRVVGDTALVTCGHEWLAAVDVRAGAITWRWNAAARLVPPGDEPEDLFVLPQRDYFVVSYQKDSKKGKKLGSRLVVFRLPGKELVADLRLPRNHEDLHIAGNKTQQGPGPEVIHVLPASNTLIVTLDLYGAVLLADWSAAREGRLAHWCYLSTAIDDSWGTSFPDRMTVFSLNQEPCALVANTGIAGGAVLVSLPRRQIIWRGTVPPGLEAPIYLPALRKAYSVCSGKTKRHTGKVIEKRYHPRAGLYVFDFHSAGALESKSVDRIATDWPLYRIARVGTCRPLLLVAGGADRADRLRLFDPRRQEFVDTRPALGTVVQFEHD